MGDEDLARDLAQESLVRVFTRWVAITNPRAYAYLVAINLSRRHSRRAAAETRSLVRLGPARTTVPDASSGTDGAWLRDLVDALPERLRTPVLLHYYADLPVIDVARALKRPVGTVKQRLHEARRLLRSSGGGRDCG